MDINQFSQSTVKGKVTLIQSGNLISVKIDATQTGTLTPGTALKYTQEVGKLPVVSVALPGDDICGFIPFDFKKSEYEAGDVLEMAWTGAVIVLEANAAIARGAKVMYVTTGVRVATAATGSNTIIGHSLDIASAQGDLVRIYLNLQGDKTAA